MKRPRRHNFIGQKFGWLTVIERQVTGHHVYWGCACDCGKYSLVTTSSLIKKKCPTVSCGCHREAVIKLWRNRLAEGQAALNRLFLHYRANARNNRHTFNLSKDDFRRLTSTECFYCGQPPIQSVSGHKRGDYLHNGIDRINSGIGYELSNCRACCKKCNIAKHSMSEQDFYAWIKRVYLRIALFVQDTSPVLNGSAAPSVSREKQSPISK